MKPTVETMFAPAGSPGLSQGSIHNCVHNRQITDLCSGDKMNMGTSTDVMRHELRIINGVVTHLIMWGDAFESKAKDVIVCVTGNPGLPDFYEEFGEKLKEHLQIPVCVIGHAGHEEVPDARSNILNGQEHKFDLKGQVKHKVELINCIDKDTRLHLIGHSIGAWMLVEILNNYKDIQSRAASVQLLFPTLQKMAETGNGFVVNRILRTFHSFILMFITLIFYLPIKVKIFLIHAYLTLASLPKHYTDRILKYVNPRVIEKVLFLAYDEMDTVRTLNRFGIEKIKDKTNVIYSDRDGWAPISQIDDLTMYEPELKLQKVTHHHAFVLKSSDKVADMASEFIRFKM